jgi:hypothetical protein
VLIDEKIEFDTGLVGAGPWLTWHAIASRDGAFPPGSFSVKDKDGRSPVDLSLGCVFDWRGSQTGWGRNTGVAGVAPEKKWNASRARFESKPADDWHRGHRVPIAYLANGRQTYAVWEQFSASAY